LSAAMLLVRRSAARAHLVLRRLQPRRFDSHTATHGDHAHPPMESVNESFGPGFYISLATLTTGFVLYRLTQSTEKSASHTWISSLIDKWTPSERIWEERNAIRTAAMEKAAEDRHLFLGARPNDTIDLLSQEIFNTGSPFNVPAGSTADLSAVAAHYHRRNREVEERRIARMKYGQVVSLYD